MESAGTKRSRIYSAANWLWEEFWKILPIALFFLTGFMLVLLIVKLTLAQYSIEVSTVSKAVIGALIAAKVVLILHHTSLDRSFREYPRVLSVIWRTIFYGLAFIFLAIAERVLDQRREHGGLANSMSYVAQHMEMHRVMALAVGIAMVFCVYFILLELSEYLGPGVIFRIFFRRHPQSFVSKIKSQSAI